MVPAQILEELKKTRDRLGLAILPRQSTTSGNLRAAHTLTLADIFANGEIAMSWETDGEVIRHVYGEEDRMGGVNPGDRRALYYLVLGLRPVNVLEIGTHIAASTLHIARALKRLNRGGRVTTVDIMDVNHPEDGAWRQLGLSRPPREFARQLGCWDQIDFRTGPSLELLHTTSKRYDFVFLDGDHSARAVYQEVCAALSLLNPGGVILLHDYYPGGKSLYPDSATISGPFHALERMQRENSSIHVVPLGDLPWPTKQGKNVTTLALVARTLESPKFRIPEPEKQETTTVPLLP